MRLLGVVPGRDERTGSCPASCRARPPARRGPIRPSPSPSSTSESNAWRSRPAARMPASTTAGTRASRAAVQVCLRCVASRPRTARRCSAPARPGSPEAMVLRGRAAGEDAGGDGVVDALPRHRVHQRGGVADEQHPAVGLLPAPAGQRQVVALPVAAVGHGGRQQLLELLEQQRPAREPPRGTGRSREQLAVPDVAPAVAAVEGPGVRRLGARAVADDLGAASRLGGGGVAADRDGPRLADLAEQVRSQHRVHAVGADDDLRLRVRRPARPGRRAPRPGAPGASPAPRRPPRRARPAARRTPRAGRRTPRAPSVRRPGCPRAPARGGAAGSSRRPRRRPRRLASASSTCGAIPSPQLLSRGKSARSSSSTRRPGDAFSAPSAAHDPAGPAPTTTRSQTHQSGARHSQAHHQQHRVEQGDPDRRRERRAAPAAQHHDGQGDHDHQADDRHPAPTRPRRAARAPTRSRAPRPRPPAAAAPRAGAAARARPWRRSSSMSGSTLSRWAPTPRQAAASGSHTGGRPGSSPASHTKTGRAPNAAAYGAHDQAVAFRPRL